MLGRGGRIEDGREKWRGGGRGHLTMGNIIVGRFHCGLPTASRFPPFLFTLFSCKLRELTWLYLSATFSKPPLSTPPHTISHTYRQARMYTIKTVHVFARLIPARVRFVHLRKFAEELFHTDWMVPGQVASEIGFKISNKFFLVTFWQLHNAHTGQHLTHTHTHTHTQIYIVTHIPLTQSHTHAHTHTDVGNDPK